MWLQVPNTEELLADPAYESAVLASLRIISKQQKKEECNGHKRVGTPLPRLFANNSSISCTYLSLHLTGSLWFPVSHSHLDTYRNGTYVPLSSSVFLTGQLPYLLSVVVFPICSMRSSETWIRAMEIRRHHKLCISVPASLCGSTLRCFHGQSFLLNVQKTSAKKGLQRKQQNWFHEAIM